MQRESCVLQTSHAGSRSCWKEASLRDRLRPAIGDAADGRYMSYHIGEEVVFLRARRLMWLLMLCNMLSIIAGLAITA
jgi:hypothetical protein